MPNKNSSEQYDPRWFIWTIVFLIVTGVMLTAYVAFSPDPIVDSYSDVVNNKAVAKTAK